ncbi:hypothetical protein QCA50_017928 [Cerrena zonata]|uniref:Cytochrome P450 n=1 Tax=Cerrena zonata TaxID=2478898 RepID=A0AAW0FQI0_9APHY
MAEDHSTVVLYTLLALATTVYLGRWLRPGKNALPSVPTIGYTAPILSYYSAVQFVIKGREMVQEGYNKYKGGAFKVPELFYWHVVVTGPKLIDDLRKAGSDELSFNEAAAEMLAVDFTLGPSIHKNTYHVAILKNQLTRGINILFPEMKDELQSAFNDLVPSLDGWVKIPAFTAATKIISRISNRVFVGLPKCRDPEYCALNIEFAVSVAKSAFFINMFPQFLRPLAARLLTNVPKNIESGVQHLGPIIKQRLKMREQYGKDWEGKPNDLLMWFMDEAEGEEKAIRSLVLRILTVNFASIHTTSMSFTHALFRLAANPEFIQPLRDEVSQVIKEEGWTRNALQRMRKVDSFLRESNRCHGLGSITMTRKALKDFTFSDGTFIPKGCFVSAAEAPTHFDEANYEYADVFNPWRFVDEEDTESMKNQMVTTSTEYVTFGHGRFACPGRFFAANELKAMMAYTVLNYDVKMENEGVIPEPVWYSVKVMPNATAEVMFRRRQT